MIKGELEWGCLSSRKERKYEEKEELAWVFFYFRSSNTFDCASFGFMASFKGWPVERMEAFIVCMNTMFIKSIVHPNLFSIPPVSTVSFCFKETRTMYPTIC